jgi:hypothetical protein
VRCNIFPDFQNNQLIVFINTIRNLQVKLAAFIAFYCANLRHYLLEQAGQRLKFSRQSLEFIQSHNAPARPPLLKTLYFSRFRDGKVYRLKPVFITFNLNTRLTEFYNCCDNPGA